MTTIHGLGGALPPRTGQRATRPGGFRLAEGAATAPTAAGGPVENVSLGGLLAAQEAGPASVRDRAARRHGHRMLELLRALQRATLTNGGDSAADTLAGLAELAAAIPATDDPELALVMRAIAVRAAVEIARREPPPRVRK